MGGIDRRSVFVAAAAAATGAAVLPAMAQPAMRRLAELKKEADIACLYHCDFGDPPRFVQMLQNIANHYSVYGNPFDLQLCVVAHGQGVKFFLETLEGTTWKDEAMVPQLFQRVRDVAKNGLQVLLCDITFERLKLDRSRTRKDEFLSFVPSGVATVAALQTKGYAYLKVG
ncbi:MAG: DsrE family protein [Methylocystis sp.]|nr:DsrE family protein [Methylocystis sp.]MCA3588981.1 DsrE family protein [Methylocystis sp.]MCA3593436.1 DsrE family protein [Methylocystis sp.]